MIAVIRQRLSPHILEEINPIPPLNPKIFESKVHPYLTYAAVTLTTFELRFYFPHSTFLWDFRSNKNISVRTRSYRLIL